MRTINIDALSKVFDLIINKLESEGYAEVELDTDLYRYIPTDKWDSFGEVEVETGSLYDDIESLELLLSNSNRPCTYVDFDRLASLLRAISQKNNPPQGSNANVSK